MTHGPLKTPPVLRTTFKIITNLQNVRATLYETVSQVSSEKKKQYTTLATAGRQVIVYLQRKRLDVAVVEHMPSSVLLWTIVAEVVVAECPCSSTTKVDVSHLSSCGEF